MANALANLPVNYLLFKGHREGVGSAGGRKRRASGRRGIVGRGARFAEEGYKWQLRRVSARASLARATRYFAKGIKGKKQRRGGRKVEA